MIPRRWPILGGLAIAALAVALPTASTGDLAQSGAIVFSARPNARDAIGWQLFVARADGRGRRLTRVDGDSAPSWSPDGSQVVFDRQGGDCGMAVCNEIRIVRADGTRGHAVTPPSVRADNPDWSPRNDLIAYVQWAGSSASALIRTDIYVMSVSGGQRRRLTFAPGEDADPAWSPDGRRIVFSSNRHGNFELYVMNADGSHQRRLTRTRSDEYDPAWSPDGNRVAFWRRGGPFPGDSVVVIGADGTGERTLSRRSDSANEPAWSPDGKSLVYGRGTPGSLGLDAEVWSMAANGARPRRLIRGQFTEPAGPDWAPARAD